MAFPTVEAVDTQGFSDENLSKSVDLTGLGTINSGDLLLMGWTNNARLADSTTSTPSGWTEISAPTADDGSFIVHAVYARVADGSEGSSVTVTQSGARSACVILYRISGWEGTLLSGLESSAISTGDAGTSNTPSPITPSWGAADTLFLVLFGWGDDNETVSSWSTGYTGNYVVAGDINNESCQTGGEYRAVNTTTESPSSVTISGTESWVYRTFAIQPDAGGGDGTGTGAPAAQAATVSGSGTQSGSSSVTGTGALSAQAATVAGTGGAHAEFDADFERANLNTSSSSITNPGTSTPSVTIVPRVQTTNGVTKHWYYFFKLTNAKGKTPSFSISETNYYLGSGGYPNPVFSYDRSTWTEFDNHADGGTTWTFSHNTAFTSDTVYICYHYPFGMTELGAWIFASLFGHAKVTAPPSNVSAPFVSAQTVEQTTDDGRTVPQQNIYAFKITDSATEPDDGYGKRTCVLFAGTHAGEDVGNYQLQGAVEYLLDGSAVANRLLKNWNFFIYPMVNPAGRWGGHFRGSWESGAETEDPNRNINTGNLDHMTKVRDAVLEDTNSSVDAFADFHGWHGVGNYGFYGANTTAVDEWVAAIEAYTGSLSDHGTDASTWNSGYHTAELGADHSFTPESHHDNMDNLAEMKAYGEATMMALDDLYVAGSFAVDNGGSGTPAAQSSAVSGSGAVTSSGVSGSGTPSAQAATASGAGTQTVSGTGTPSAQAAQVSGSSSTTFTGTGSPAAQSASVAGSGSQTVSGTGSPSAQSASVSGTGTQIVYGSGAPAANDASVTGSDSAGGTGTGTPSAQASTVNGSGTQTVSGTGAPACQVATLAAVGTQTVSGSGALSSGASSVAGLETSANGYLEGTVTMSPCLDGAIAMNG